MKFSKLIYVTILILCAVNARAEDGPAIRANIDRKSVYIGDRITYSIDVTFSPDYQVEFPKFRENKLGVFEIKDSRMQIKKKWVGKRVASQRYSIVSYSVGTQTIPPIEIRYRKAGSEEWQTRKTDALPVNIKSILPRGERNLDIKDIKAPISLGGIKWHLVIAAAVALVILWRVSAFIKKIKSRAKVRFPHEIAMDELNAARDFLLKGGAVKEYYSKISDSIRRYIEVVFRLRAPEMTSEEFLFSMKNSSILTADQNEAMERFLLACDMVKFARYAPKMEESENLFKTAKKFVEETKGASIDTGARF